MGIYTKNEIIRAQLLEANTSAKLKKVIHKYKKNPALVGILETLDLGSIVISVRLTPIEFAMLANSIGRVTLRNFLVRAAKKKRKLS